MSRFARSCILVLIAMTLLPGSGCVRRRLNVRTNPPGALVYVDNQQIGTTPCSVDFVYYGTREIRLVKPGYETLTVNQPIPTPWYQIPPLDFVSENLVPTKIRDNRTVMYDLAPQIVVPTEQLLDRAQQLRQETVSPVSLTMPPVPPIVGPTVVGPPVGLPTGPPTMFAPQPGPAPPMSFGTP
jgi:PEGA domain